MIKLVLVVIPLIDAILTRPFFKICRSFDYHYFRKNVKSVLRLCIFIEHIEPTPGRERSGP